jgi:PP-loop superfamily ATP-utilizing enzyme
MRILLDECVPWPMHRFLVGHSCTTAQRQGWKSIQNGDLLRLAETEFALFVTSDQNIRYQQNLADRQIAILELSTNDLRRIMAARDQIVAAVATMESRAYVRLEIP